jgi:hypothetical protein
VAVAAPAQIPVPVNSRYGRTLERLFGERFAGLAQQKSTLEMKVQPAPLRMAYSFRYVAGLFAEIPARQFRGEQQRMAIALRVTPLDGGDPRYFLMPMALPPIPDNVGRSTVVETGGGFYVGEGRYRVDLIAEDGQKRFATKSWTFEAKPSKFKLQIAPHAVEPPGLEDWKGLAQKPSASGKVTVFVNAMPIYARRYALSLPIFERVILLGGLTSLLDQSRFAEARVVVYDLMGKRVLFQDDHFDRDGYQRLLDVLNRVQYSTVSVQTLQQGRDVKILGDLLNQEATRKDPSDAIVFMGAEGRFSPKLPPALAETVRGLPPMFYLPFSRFPIPMEDIAFRAVKAAKGKTMTIFTPQDLANAIKAINEKTPDATSSSDAGPAR